MRILLLAPQALEQLGYVSSTDSVHSRETTKKFLLSIFLLFVAECVLHGSIL